MTCGGASGARDWERPDALLGVDEARERILAALAPLPPERLPLLDALGLVLSEDIVADVDIPPFRNSAMDGYAVRAANTAGATPEHPAVLRVVGEVPAGAAPELTVGPGESVRIMTGALVPEGADAVVRFEETDELEHPGSRERVSVQRAVGRGANVRAAGEDVARGSVVLPAGTDLGAAELGLLAALNYARAPVHRPPRVAILSTGDELVPAGVPLAAGQIRDSNSILLAALVKQLGAQPLSLGAARDDVDEIRRRLARARGADLLLTSGGVSVGDFDLVKRVLRQEGHIDLWQVRIKPGKPMAFGCIGETPLIGLPGNPVAALVAFLQFARPAIQRMLGRVDWSPPLARARLACPLENRGRRRHFVRGVVEHCGDALLARPAGPQGAATLSSVARANCLIIIPEEWDHAPAGAEVDIELLDNLGPR
ncbi:MAG TPA: gephyrin-like molybdotransferase Glp, partial [Thermomicrobiaceae bacterium]|nr:gephyrin-like molybdotransferase Glp [Thermomicrobiaceae bacterium]